jgi:hypothetical protein
MSLLDILSMELLQPSIVLEQTMWNKSFKDGMGELMPNDLKFEVLISKERLVLPWLAEEID